MCLAICDAAGERLLDSSDAACKASLLEVLWVAFNRLTVRVPWGHKSVESRSVLDNGFEMLSRGGGCGEEAAG